MAVTVSSTTDTQEQVTAAANYGLKATSEAAAASPEAENEEHPEAEEAESGAEPEPAQDDESEETPEEEEEESEEAAATDRHMGKTRRKLLRQISRLNGRNVSLQEQLDAAEERLKRLEGGEKAPVSAAQTAAQAKPNPKDYKDYEEYVEALADWKIAQRDAERAQAAQRELVQEIIDDYNQQVEAARETHDDYDTIVGTSAQVPIIAINAMYELENGAEVAYYLGQHPEVRAQLLEWNQPGFRGGIRKILAKLNNISEDISVPPAKSSASRSPNAPVRPRPSTTAPPPIKPVGNASASKPTGEAPKSFQDYKKWYAKRYPNSR